ncbi:hypothetical protein JCM5353_007420 [Sporobolomyces roseus]
MPQNSPAIPSTSSTLIPPSLNSGPSHRVLSLYYPHLQPLAALFDGPLVKDKDSERFSTFLNETLVGIRGGGDELPRFKEQGFEDKSIVMSEILNQVLSRIFTLHSVEYYKNRKLGLPAFSTPKNVLACGHKLSSQGSNINTVSVGTGPLYESVFTNTILSSLISSKDWSLLLSRVGPDPIIKLLSSPNIALFGPLKNGCYYQIAGEPVVELKVIEKEKENERKKGGRKVHCRTKKRRGKKKGKKERGEEERDGAVCGREAGDSTVEMEVDQDCPHPPIEEASQAVVSPIKRVKFLGPSKSAPSLLPSTSNTPLLSLSNTQSQQTAQTQGQLSLTKRSNSISVNASTVVALKGTQAGLEVLRQKKTSDPQLAAKKIKRLPTLNSNNSIVFSRHRIYHARLPKTKLGKTLYGLSSKHILSRLSTTFTLQPTAALPSSLKNPQEYSHLLSPARHLAKYVFPRQFGLHNVFDRDKVNLWMRVRPDYEDREMEIKKLGLIKTPERVKSALGLLGRLSVLHERCNYRKLLGIKCPSKVPHRKLDDQEKSLVVDMLSEAGPCTQLSRSNLSFNHESSSSLDPTSTPRPLQPPATAESLVPSTARSEAPLPSFPFEQGKVEKEKDTKPKLSEYACTPYEVESYVQAVVRDVIPRAFWGSESNAKLIMKQISQFLRMRRFETISLHSLFQGFSLLDCEWLSTSSSSNTKKKIRSLTTTELEKRKEIMGEFLYWFFDSYVTEIVRTAFYVTDSATHQNRPLYFRQDDWTALTLPLLESLGKTVFERIPDNELIALERQPRDLGFSYVRLLPKEFGVRPIVNLARRPLHVGHNGEVEVGQPINKILRGVFDVLTFESKRKPHLVGSLVSNPQEIYAKLKEYKMGLLDSDEAGVGKLPELYFVKVDVKACFDTIKQDKLLELVEEILSDTLYYIQKYSQVVSYAGKTARQFKRQACGDDDLGSFKELAMQLAEDLHDVVLTDQVRYDDVDKDKLMSLLKEHITTNLVKVNGRLYRQTDGIPQGSVLSSLLCSLFYGDMENTHLSFTRDIKSLLMRYVDDFMFVTTKKHLAVRFLQIMHRGIPEYGCFISTEKRLTNFDVSLEDGEVVPPLADGEDFGYCGLAIDTKTLEIKMNLQLQMTKEIVNQLTVQRYRKPGEAFLNAMLRAVKVRSHSMYTDTNFNSSNTVYSNIYQAMLVVALKFRAYVQEWSGGLKGKVVFFWNALQKIVKYEYSALVRQSRGRKAARLSATFDLERTHVLWLGYHAFHRVLSRQPSTFSPLVRLLLAEIKTSKSRNLPVELRKIVKDDKNRFLDKSKRL